MKLSEKIERIKELGLPLPTISYEFGMYQSVVPENVDIGLGGINGVEIPELHDTFEDACDRIIKAFD